MASALPKREHAAPARGEDTRQRLINAALEVFGNYGFDGASTRMLAEKAGANLAAIPYHFGGKEGLYRAAAEFVVENSIREMAPALDRINRSLADGTVSRRIALELLHQLLDRFSALVIGPSDADTWAGFILREQLHPGAAFEILHQGIMNVTTSVCARLLAIILNASEDDLALVMRVQTILGQVIVFRSGRASALRRLGTKEFSPRHLKMIQSIIRENVDRIIGNVK
jgi:AcrR family transcriptional regulator